MLLDNPDSSSRLLSQPAPSVLTAWHAFKARYFAARYTARQFRLAGN